MSVVTLVKFVQGASIGTPGVSLIGVTGTTVQVSNGGTNPSPDPGTWTFTVLGVPSASAVPTGVVQSGSTPTWNFVPDVAGTYVVQLQVTDNTTGATSTDVRSFGIYTSLGSPYLIPSFTASPPSLNFGGQATGWDKYMEAWLNLLVSLAGGGSSISEANKVYVSLTGNDFTGDGSIGKPFATYAKASTVATSRGAASGNQYAVVYAPGSYAENPLTLKPWIDIMAADDANLGDTTSTSGAVVLTGQVNLHSSWVAAGNGVAGVSGVRIVGDVLLDYGSLSIPNARVVFRRCAVVGTAFFTDSDAFTSTTEIWNCQIFSSGSGTGFYCSNNGTMKVFDSLVNMPAALSSATMFAYGTKFLSGFSLLNATETLNAFGCEFKGLGTGGFAAVEVETNALATINAFGGYADSVYMDGSATTSHWTSWGTSVAGNVHLVGTGAHYQSDLPGIGTSQTLSGGALGTQATIKGSGGVPATWVLASDGAGGWTPTAMSGGGGASGDNAAALRANKATTLPGGSNGSQVIADLAVTDGAEGLFAGTAIGFTGSGGGGQDGPAKLYFAGTTVAHGEGGLFSFDVGGERIEFLGSLPGPHNPDDLTTFSIANNPDYTGIATVGKGGMNIWGDGFLQADNFTLVTHAAGGEDWTGGRIAAIPQFANSEIVFWTAPTPGKVYSDSVNGGLFTTALTIAEQPKAICKDNQSRIWISFLTSNKVRKYTTTLVDGSLTQQGADISNAGTSGVTDMVFDGAFIWTLNTSTGALAKLSGSDGSLVASITLSSITAQSRLIYDGEAIVVTGATGADFYVRVDPDSLAVVFDDFLDLSNITLRGVAAIPGGGLFVVGKVTSGGTSGHLYLGRYHPPQGDFPLYRRRLSRAQTSGTITSVAALNIQTQPGNLTSGTSANIASEYTVTAIAASGSPVTFAWFKTRARVLSDGTWITGDPVAVDDSPKKNAQATTDGLGFSIAPSGSFLVGTATQTSGTTVYWSFLVEVSISTPGNWY